MIQMPTTNGPETYDESYFVSGARSCLKDYTEESEAVKTRTNLNMVTMLLNGALIDRRFDRVVDYGCGRGFLVRALNEDGFTAQGIDVSEWAINHRVHDGCFRCVSLRSALEHLVLPPTIITAFFTFEHIPVKETAQDLAAAYDRNVKAIIATIPLVRVDEDIAWRLVSEHDQTHCTLLRHDEWVTIFNNHGYKLTNEIACNTQGGSYRSTFLFLREGNWEEATGKVMEDYKFVGTRLELPHGVLRENKLPTSG